MIEVSLFSYDFLISAIIFDEINKPFREINEEKIWISEKSLECFEVNKKSCLLVQNLYSSPNYNEIINQNKGITSDLWKLLEIRHISLVSAQKNREVLE